MLADYDRFVKILKQIAKETIAADAPVAVCFGTVTSEEPLQILVDQKLPLSQAQLILTRNVTDYYTDETVFNSS